LWGCCWVKKDIEHELHSISTKGNTYSKQKHPLGWGGSAVSNIKGYRLLIAGEVERKEADLEEVVVGGLRPWGGEGDRGKGRWWRSSEDLAEFHLRPHFCNEVNEVNKS
jgi:hypothetical protein